jgi:hypothetical protein
MQRGADAAKRGDVEELLENLAHSHVKVAKIEEVGVPILEGRDYFEFCELKPGLDMTASSAPPLKGRAQPGGRGGDVADRPGASDVWPLDRHEEVDQIEHDGRAAVVTRSDANACRRRGAVTPRQCTVLLQSTGLPQVHTAIAAAHSSRRSWSASAVPAASMARQRQGSTASAVASHSTRCSAAASVTGCGRGMATRRRSRP